MFNIYACQVDFSTLYVRIRLTFLNPMLIIHPLTHTLDLEVIFMDTNVIHWKLNELMARKRIRNKDLALALGITENSVYRLRRTDEMPRLSPERLNGICTFLLCQPGELLVWTPDGDDLFNNSPSENSPTSSPSNQSSSSTTDKQLDSYLPVRIVEDLPYSA